VISPPATYDAGEFAGATRGAAHSGRMLRWAIDRAWRAAAFGFLALIVLSLVLPQAVVILSALNTATIVSFPLSGVTLRWFVRAVANPDFAEAALHSAVVAGATALIAGSLGTLIAYAGERFAFRGRRLLEAGLSLPLLIPHFTLGLGLLITAFQLGVARTYGVIVAAHVLLVLPFVMRSVYVSLANLDETLPLAAATLGARPLTIVLRIELPLLAPGILCGLLLAAILSFTEFSASLFLVGRHTQTLPVAMYNYIQDFSEPTIAAVAAMMIVAVAAVLACATRLIGLKRVLA